MAYVYSYTDKNLRVNIEFFQPGRKYCHMVLQRRSIFGFIWVSKYLFFKTQEIHESDAAAHIRGSAMELIDKYKHEQQKIKNVKLDLKRTNK